MLTVKGTSQNWNLLDLSGDIEHFSISLQTVLTRELYSVIKDSVKWNCNHVRSDLEALYLNWMVPHAFPSVISSWGCILLHVSHFKQYIHGSSVILLSTGVCYSTWNGCYVWTMSEAVRLAWLVRHILALGGKMLSSTSCLSNITVFDVWTLSSTVGRCEYILNV